MVLFPNDSPVSRFILLLIQKAFTERKPRPRGVQTFELRAPGRLFSRIVFPGGSLIRSGIRHSDMTAAVRRSFPVLPVLSVSLPFESCGFRFRRSLNHSRIISARTAYGNSFGIAVMCYLFAAPAMPGFLPSRQVFSTIGGLAGGGCL